MLFCISAENVQKFDYLECVGKIPRNTASHSLFILMMYTVLHMFRQVLFGAGNQSNDQNFEKSLLTNKLWHVFMGMKQKFFFFSKKKNFFLLHSHENMSKFIG